MAPAPRVNRRGRVCAAALLLAAALPASPARAAGTGDITIVALGDSLTAGYQLGPEDAFPVRLAAALKERGHDVTLVNAGVSGDTSAGGLARLDWSVGADTDGVIVELGANDALRGIAPSQTSQNLDALLARLTGRGIPVLLAGMLAPRNLGSEYASEFDAIYPDLAEKHGAILYPFFLDGVVTDPALNIDDGMHPNPGGIAVIVERIMPSVEKLLEKIAARRDAGD